MKFTMVDKDEDGDEWPREHKTEGTFSFARPNRFALVTDETGNDLLLLGLVSADGVFTADGVLLRRTDDGRKGKGTIHWGSAEHAVKAEVRLYDRLCSATVPGGETGNVGDDLNPDSLTVLHDCRLEPSLSGAKPGDRYQFERLGYFCVDPDSKEGSLVFNRTISLRDSWAKIAKTSG